jgi:hypothetical protein
VEDDACGAGHSGERQPPTMQPLAGSSAGEAGSAAAAAAAEALSRGALVFPVRSTVGLQALDVGLQTQLRKGMGDPLYKQYVQALTVATGPTPPPLTAGGRQPQPPAHKNDWWHAMPPEYGGSVDPWQGDKALLAAAQVGNRPKFGDSPLSARIRPGLKVTGAGSSATKSLVGQWLDTYGSPRRLVPPKHVRTA